MTLKIKIIVLFAKSSWCNITQNLTVGLYDLACSSFTGNKRKTEQCVRFHESEENEGAWNATQAHFKSVLVTLIVIKFESVVDAKLVSLSKPLQLLVSPFTQRTGRCALKSLAASPPDSSLPSLSSTLFWNSHRIHVYLLSSFPKPCKYF